MLIKNSTKLFGSFGLILSAACCLMAYASVGVAFCQGVSQSPATQLNASAADTTEDRSSAGVIVTRWVDPQGRVPVTYREWKEETGERGMFEIGLARAGSRLRSPDEGTKMCVIVNASLYTQIQSSLDQYVLDLTGEGYDVEVDTMSGGTPEDLRTFLQDRYSLGMEGCVLIGDLPIAWYETECWDPQEHEEFPCDLFYMDMDGYFNDADRNSIFDHHSGEVGPEIWVGRLTASPLAMGGANEVSLLENYFYKNHLYRTGSFVLYNRALVYIDDDWSQHTDWDQDVGLAYDERTFVNDDWTTWATDYEGRLPENYEFIQVCAHSSPYVHAFKNPSENWSYTYNSEVKAIDPLAHFYNLFACSNARYVTTDYMAGWYVFRQDYGLAALGSTKTGSMLNFDYFYRPFGLGKTIGEAFRDWFISRASGGFEDWEVCWFYGMTLIGDPTLIKMTICVDADGDGFGDPGHPENGCPDDNCPTVWNPDQEDADADGIGDSCDVCTDTDNDGYGNPGYPVNTCEMDNCPYDYNPGQEDNDGDGTGNACCCADLAGNVDCDPGEVVDIGDLTRLLDYLYISREILCCPLEANVDGDVGGIVDISDVTALLDYLYIRPGVEPPAACL